MKYKLFGIIAFVFVFIISILNYPAIFSINHSKRYHQHLESPPKEPCANHQDNELCTHLPLIVINTFGSDIPGRGIKEGSIHRGRLTAPDGSNLITAQMSVIDSKTGNNHPFDMPSVSSRISIRVRGNSSRYFDKLSYKLELINENGKKNPQSLAGMPAHHEWALHGPFLDKTLIRNYMWYNIAGECMSYAPNVRFCELIINEEYMGLYVLTEIISGGKGNGRLALSVDSKGNTYNGYLLRLDRDDKREDDRLRSLTTYSFRSDMDLKLEVDYPYVSKLTPELKQGIKTDFSAFEKALYSYDYDNKKYGYKNFIDVNSFVDYFLLNEFTVNYDAGSYSTYIYKDVSDRLKMCPWDFNNSCDNYQEKSMMQVQHFEIHNKLWFSMLTKDEDFTQRIVSRYRELRKGCLSEEYLLNYIDDVIAYLGPAIDRNFEKWGYSFEDESLLTPSERNFHSYDEAVAQLKKFICLRGAWMDDNIQSIQQYSAESKVKKYNEISD